MILLVKEAGFKQLKKGSKWLDTITVSNAIKNTKYYPVLKLTKTESMKV